jgi:murein DD-endopeptidase MepM/ murein hydrolase activator NlpD
MIASENPANTDAKPIPETILMKQLRKMTKTPLLKLSRYGLCLAIASSLFSATGITTIGITEARAGQKSKISPENIAPKAASQTNPAPVTAPTIQPEPVQSEPAQIERIAPPVEIQTGRNNTQVVAPASAVEIQARQTQNSNPATNKQNSGNVDIVFESRSTGCQASDRELSGRQANLCAPEVAIARNQPTNLIYSSSGEAIVQVRKLTPAEIESMSVPSNGDKRMLFPLSIPALISSSFGYRVHPISKVARFHQGTDIAADTGTPVIAAYSGKVEISGWLGGYGLAVVISHGDTHETRYAHLSEIFVKPGQEVKQGTVIGLVGSTGFSTGPHLHFELWEKIAGNWTVMDPMPHLILALERLDAYLAQKNNPPQASNAKLTDSKLTGSKLSNAKPQNKLALNMARIRSLFVKTAKG